MAKSKPTAKTAETKEEKPVKAVKAAKAAKTAAPPVKAGRGVKSEEEAARTPGTLSDVEIGHVAGELWGVLAREGAMTVAAIKKAVPAPGDNVMAAIGWLAREHKLVFSSQGRSVKISLH